MHTNSGYKYYQSAKKQTQLCPLKGFWYLTFVATESEQLLGETKLTIDKTDEICRASESTLVQMKIMGNCNRSIVNALGRAIKAKLVINENTKRHPKESTKECGNCGTERGQRTKNELCQRISRRVGNVESFHIFLSNVTARKRKIKIVQICPSFWQPRKWFGSVLGVPYHIFAVDLDDPQSRVWKLPAFSAWHWSAMQRYSS